MTILLIIITCIISVIAFNNRDLFARLQFNAYQVYHRREYYRMLTHGFVHANWWHLGMNMLVLYFFGRYVEQQLIALAGSGLLRFPVLIYLLMYLLAIVFASTISLVKYKDVYWYNAVGASGAVAAVMFFFIFFQPWQGICLYGVLCIPGILFAVLYLFYSHYMARRGGDNINHDAHFLGAVFGFVFPLFININLYKVFINQLTSVIQHFFN
jgi:membrane associated rhomboid family serine protease